MALISSEMVGGHGRGARVPLDDAAAFRSFLTGDNTAFAALFDRYHHRLHVYCLKFLGDADVAADVTQELWERVIRMRTAPRDVQNPAGLFLRMARNLCLNHRKRSGRFSPIEDLHDAHHPREDAAGDGSELTDAIEAGLARLSFDDRELLVLNAYCGYRFEEIAAMLGKRPEAIWMRASRARARLRKEVVELIGLNHTIGQHAMPGAERNANERPTSGKTSTTHRKDTP